MKYYLVVPYIHIQNANCISSPLIYGFPAVSAFTGAVHALSRSLSEKFHVVMGGVAIAAHHSEPQISRPHNYADWSFIQSRHPLKKDGSSPSIIEEGYTHLRISLIIEVEGEVDWNEQEQQDFCEAVYQKIMTQRIAGGSILSVGKRNNTITLHHGPYGDSEKIRAIQKHISPAFVLMSRKLFLEQHTKELQKKDTNKTALDALLDLCSIHIKSKSVEDKTSDTEQKTNTKIEWESTSSKQGWMVPIPVGFKGIVPPFEAGQVADIRAPQYPTHFVEAIYSVGEWCFVNKITDFNSMFWRYRTNLDQQLFLVEQETNQNDDLDF